MLDYGKLTDGNYIAKMKIDDGLDDDCDNKNTLAGHLGASILSNNKRKMNSLIREIDGFYNNNFYHTDTGSM